MIQERVRAGLRRPRKRERSLAADSQLRLPEDVADRSRAGARIIGEWLQTEARFLA
jgi:hypothetical protein